MRGKECYIQKKSVKCRHEWEMKELLSDPVEKSEDKDAVIVLEMRIMICGSVRNDWSCNNSCHELNSVFRQVHISNFPLSSQSLAWTPTSGSTMRKTVLVTAPSDLPEGYIFDVEVKGKLYSAKVPEGGIKEGEDFELPYDDDDYEGVEDEMTIGKTESQSESPSGPVMDALGAPRGFWRTYLFSCCDVLTQATFWMALCCAPVLLAQLVSRLKVNWQGKPDLPQEAILSYNKIVMSFITVLFLGTIFPGSGFFLLFAYLIFCLLWIGRNLRQTMRQKYKIPATTHESVDDCCLMAFCGCCSLIQMARHTHDDKEWPGYCCTTNGLELGAPELP